MSIERQYCQQARRKMLLFFQFTIFTFQEKIRQNILCSSLRLQNCRINHENFIRHETNNI